MARARGSLGVCTEMGDDELCVCGDAILFCKTGLTGSTCQVAQIRSRAAHLFLASDG